MPGLTEEEKRQLDELLGATTASPSPVAPPAPPIPGTLPPEIAGVAYPASFTRKGLRVNIPPPASEIQRQIVVQQQKEAAKVKAPKPLSQRQMDAIEGLQNTSATLTELVGFLQQYPEIETGLAHPSFRRDIAGDILRSFAQPETTQIAQVSNRMQDAYRRFVTGVQAGFPEVSRFLPSAIPNPATQPKDKFLAAIDTFSREVERAKVQLRRSMKLRGYTPEQIEELFAPLPALSDLPSAIGFSPQGGRPLPPGVKLAPGVHTDAQGRRIRVYQDGTYTPE